MPSIFLGLKAGYVYSVLENRDGHSSYKNDYQMFSLGVNFYLLKLIDVPYPLDRINPYVTMRAGYSKSSLSALRDRGDRSGFHGHYGLGWDPGSASTTVSTPPPPATIPSTTPLFVSMDRIAPVCTRLSAWPGLPSVCP